jgi:uncharacterized membrane protein
MASSAAWGDVPRHRAGALRRVPAFGRTVLDRAPRRRQHRGHSTRSLAMFQSAGLSELSPAVIVHLFAAVGALALGPLALWLRKGSRLHRGAGYAWITLMLGAALSSAFIRDFRLPNVLGYTPIHALTLATLVGVGLGLWHISQRNAKRHRRAMQLTYAGAIAAGVLALLPERYLGSLLWHHTLGLV